MKREKSLIKNTLILSIGKFLPKLVSFITLPIVTARLTQSEYGTYDLILTLITLLIPVATLQIQSAAFRFLIDSRDDKEKKSKIITNIWIVTIPLSLIISFGVAVYYYITYTKLIGILVGLAFFTDILYLTVSQIARGLSMNKEYSISSIIVSVTNCIGIVLAVQVSGLGLTGVMISLVISNFVGFLMISFKIKITKYFDKSLISLHEIKEMINYSWPMIPNNLSNWILNLSDRLMITFFCGVEANAVYAVANKIPNMLSLVQSVATMAWQENASLTVKDGDSSIYFSKMFDVFFSIVFGATALIISLMPILFMLLIRGNYEAAYVQMPILIMGMAFYCMSAFQGGIYIAHKKTKSVGISTLFAACINVLLNMLFINSIGITAASISTLVAYLALYLFRMKNILKLQHIDYKIKKQVAVILVVVIMVILCMLENTVANIVNVIIGVILFIVINKELIIKLKDMISLRWKNR